MTIQYIGTMHDKVELAAAREVYRAAAEELGEDLGGYSLTDLLADNFLWPLTKCENVARILTEGQS